MSESSREILELEGLRKRFDGAGRRRKAALLRGLSRRGLGDAGIIQRYHEVLLFMLAYPDDAAIFRMADGELKRLARAVRELVGNGPIRERRRLEGTGIAFTTSHAQFEWETVRALVRRFPWDLEMEWEGDSAGEVLDEWLPQLVARVERDGYLEGKLTAREWFKLAKGSGRGSDLLWLLEACDRALGGRCDFVTDRVFDSFDVKLRWELRDPLASRTFGRFPARAVFFHGGDAREAARSKRGKAKPREDAEACSPASVIGRPIPGVRRLPGGESRALLDTCLASLCVRGREIDTLSYANEREVWLVPLERGFDVAVFGMRPGRRLPIESYFGYVIAKNRLPMGYGGGWVFFDRCEIGVNIFDSFRGGESAPAFANVLRVYRQLFRAKRFQVDPYQIGEGNREAIQSGAFWFYYRLGFRPSDGKAARVAAAEWERISADRSYRSSAAVLRRLAKSNVELEIDSRSGPRSGPAPDVVKLGLAVSRWIGRRFEGSRDRAMSWAQNRVERALGISRESYGRRWGCEESAAFGDLCLVVAMIPGLEAWTGEEKRSLVELMRAKGGTRESDYVARLQRHSRLGEALREIAAEVRI